MSPGRVARAFLAFTAAALASSVALARGQVPADPVLEGGVLETLVRNDAAVRWAVEVSVLEPDNETPAALVIFPRRFELDPGERQVVRAIASGERAYGPEDRLRLVIAITPETEVPVPTESGAVRASLKTRMVWNLGLAVAP